MRRIYCEMRGNNVFKSWVTFMTKIHTKKVINIRSDWFWLKFNNLSTLLSFSCDSNQSIPPFYPKFGVYFSSSHNIEFVLNSNDTQNIDYFLLLSLLDLFSLKGQFLTSMGGDMTISQFWIQKRVSWFWRKRIFSYLSNTFV